MVQVSENEFKKVFHSNTQGKNETFTILNKDLDTFKVIIKEIEETEDSDTRFNDIDYIEREYLI